MVSVRRPGGSPPHGPQNGTQVLREQRRQRGIRMLCELRDAEAVRQGTHGQTQRNVVFGVEDVLFLVYGLYGL